jgi:hypothetical protein
LPAYPPTMGGGGFGPAGGKVVGGFPRFEWNAGRVLAMWKKVLGYESPASSNLRTNGTRCMISWMIQ